MQRIRAAVLAAGMALAVGPPGAWAQGTVQRGEAKAATCSACHGREGIASRPDAPNLAGQNPLYFEHVLKEYRSGVRKNELMSVVAKTLSDNDIRDLAAYYAAFRVTVVPPGK
jgi:cytochrome c553